MHTFPLPVLCWVKYMSVMLYAEAMTLRDDNMANIENPMKQPWQASRETARRGSIFKTASCVFGEVTRT